MKFTQQSILVFFNSMLLTLAVIVNAHADNSLDRDLNLLRLRLVKDGESMQDLLNRFNQKRSEVPCDFVALETSLEQAERDIKARIEQTKKSVTSCEAISICQKDVGPSGLVITTSGYYRLRENIVFDPNADFLGAITIMASDVTLDLNGKVLSESPAGFAAFDHIEGIIIASGSNSVSIKNGKVTGFSDNGIWASSNFYPTPLPTEHTGLSITNIKVTNCGKLNTFNTVRTFKQRGGIAIDGATSVSIERCCVSHIASLLLADAIDGFSVNDILIKDCKTSFAATPGTQSSTSHGIILFDFSNAIVDSCTGTNVSGMAPAGMIGQAGDTLIVRNFKARNNQATLYTVGIGLSNTSNVLITHCETSDNSSANIDPTESFVRAFGILNQINTNVIVKDCVLNRNGIVANLIPPSSTPIYAAGIVTGQCNGVLVENCRATENFVSPGVAATQVGGFFVTAPSSNIEHRHCLADNHSSENPAITVAGFLVGLTAGATQEGIVLDACVAKRNINRANPANGYGVLFGSDEFTHTIINSSILNSEARCNDIGFGIAGLPTTGNLIQGNTALNNNLFGFLDTSCDSNSYLDNCSCNPNATGLCDSFSCGTEPLSGNANFCGLPAGTPPQKEGHCNS